MQIQTTAFTEVGFSLTFQLQGGWAQHARRVESKNLYKCVLEIPLNIMQHNNTISTASKCWELNALKWISFGWYWCVHHSIPTHSSKYEREQRSCDICWHKECSNTYMGLYIKDLFTALCAFKDRGPYLTPSAKQCQVLYSDWRRYHLLNVPKCVFAALW